LRAPCAAPHDSAFAAVEPWMLAYFEDPANTYKLLQLLGYHAAVGAWHTKNLLPNQEITTAMGQPVYVEYITSASPRLLARASAAVRVTSRGRVRAADTRTLGLASATCDNNINFLGDEIVGVNGVVQVIDTLMFPSRTTVLHVACIHVLFAFVSVCVRPRLCLRLRLRIRVRCSVPVPGVCILSCCTYSPCCCRVDCRVVAVTVAAEMLCMDEFFYSRSSPTETEVGKGGYDCRNKGFSPIARGEQAPLGVAVDSGAGAVFWTSNPVPAQAASFVSASALDGSMLQRFYVNASDARGTCA
jgi:hypothetical protein